MQKEEVPILSKFFTFDAAPIFFNESLEVFEYPQIQPDCVIIAEIFHAGVVRMQMNVAQIIYKIILNQVSPII